MSNTKLSKLRTSAFSRQRGRCFYCSSPMWQKNDETFQQIHRVTEQQARQLECTAEHLHAKQDGGHDRPDNIVAACSFCNSRRHRLKKPLCPEAYLDFVQRKMSQGKWPTANFFAGRTTRQHFKADEERLRDQSALTPLNPPR